MDTASARQAKADIDSVGHTVTFKRVTGKIPNQTTVTKDVKAVVAGYKPEELVGDITVGSRQVIVSDLALSAAGFPVPVVKGDYIISMGREMIVLTVDRDHREYLGCVDIVATGQ